MPLGLMTPTQPSESFKPPGMDAKQAEVVVAAISRSDAQLATKADLAAAVAELKAEMFRALWIQGAGIVALIVGLTKLL